MHLLKKIKTFCSVMTLVMVLSTDSFAVPGDFDADGTSDLSVALVDRATNTTAWLTRRTNGASPFFWTFNSAADALASMRFHTGDPRYYPAIIRVVDIGQPLEWRIKNSANQEVVLRYGLPGDIIPNQGDFDCDGREDPTVVRNINGILHWYIARTATNTILHTTFGVSGDQVGISDTKADCTADLVVLRKNFFWYVRDPASLDFSTTQWGFNNDIPLLPGDYDGDGLTDFAIARKSPLANGGQTGFVKLGNGQAFTRQLGFNSSIPQIGKFSKDAPSDFAWSQRDTGWTAIRNNNGSVTGIRLGIPQNIIIRADGTVVQPTSSAIFPFSTEPVQLPPSGGGATTGCSASPGTETDFVDGANGSLWKPISEGVSNRASVILLPIGYCGAGMDILGRDGNSVSGVQRRSCGGNGNRAHFWLQKTASQLSSFAPLTVKITKGGSTECRSVPNPRERYD